MLILKTNNYLRAIDKRLGDPTNSFHSINETTWTVFRNEVPVTRWVIMREGFRYYWLRLCLFLYKMKISMMHSLGKVSNQELEDFDEEFQ